MSLKINGNAPRTVGACFGLRLASAACGQPDLPHRSGYGGKAFSPDNNFDGDTPTARSAYLHRIGAAK